MTWAPPRGYDGQLEVVYLEDRKSTKLRRADPRVTVTAEWFYRIRQDGVATFDGQLLKIHTDDGSAVYRVDHHDVVRSHFLMAWPD